MSACIGHTEVVKCERPGGWSLQDALTTSNLAGGSTVANIEPTRANAQSQTIEYRDIPGWPGYRISDSGNVQTRRTFGGKLRTEWKPKATSRSHDGYLCVTLHRSGKCRFFRVHDLVLLSFVGPSQAGQMGLHRNANRTDNRIGNLYWGTAQDNADDRNRDGHTARRERNGRARITAEIATHIRHVRATEGSSYARLGLRFGISNRQVARICDGLNWV